MTYAALANHRQPHLDCLAYLSQLIAAHIVPDQRQQASAASIDIPEKHELALLQDVLPRPLHGNDQAELL